MKVSLIEFMRFCYPEGDSVYLFSKSSKKRTSVVVDDAPKLKEKIDKAKKKIGPDMQACLFTIKDAKGTNARDNLFRSKIYMWADIDFKIDNTATEEKLLNLNPPPTFVLKTTGGYHVLWVGDETIYYGQRIENHYSAFLSHLKNQGVTPDTQARPNFLTRLPECFGSDSQTVIGATFTGNIYNAYEEFSSQIQSIKEYEELTSSGMSYTGSLELSYDELALMMKRCTQLKHFEETGGNSYDEWSLFSMIFAYSASCEKNDDSRENVKKLYHKCCSAYRSYNPRECSLKLDGLIQHYLTKRFRFIPSCERLRMVTGISCDLECLKFPAKDVVGKVNFIQFQVPEPYYEKDRQLWKYGLGANATDVCVCNTFLRGVFSVKDVTTGEHWLKLASPHDQYILPEKTIGNRVELMKLLFSNHITTFEESAMMFYMKLCQSRVKVIPGTNRVGYVDGMIVQSNDYDVYPILNDVDHPFLKNYASRRGNYEEYLSKLTHFLRTYPLFALAYAVGLIQFLPISRGSNLIVRLFGKSGIGKNLLLFYAKSIVGDPMVIPMFKNMTPLKAIDIASKTSFFVLDEFVMNSKFDDTSNPIFSIHSGFGRMSYNQASPRNFKTTMICAGEERLLTSINIEKGLHRRIYEMYANVPMKMMNDMIAGLEIIKAHYGFLREIRDDTLSRSDKAITVADEAYNIMMSKEYENINHTDVIKHFSYVVALAHLLSGFDLEELCKIASSTDTMFTDGETTEDRLIDAVDYCVTAYTVVESMYEEAKQRYRKVITRPDVEAELRKNQLNYYPEVERFIKLMFGWGKANVKRQGKMTTRMGIIVQDRYPPMVCLMQYLCRPAADTRQEAKRDIADLTMLFNELREDKKGNIYITIFVEVALQLRASFGTTELPELGSKAVDDILDLIREKERGIRIVKGGTYVDQHREPEVIESDLFGKDNNRKEVPF